MIAPPGAGRADGLPQRVLVPLGLAVLALLVFSRVAANDFVLLDDETYLLANPNVRNGLTWHSLGWAFRSIQAANWHPLTWISHMVDVELFGLAPRGHHVASALIHAANTALLYLALRGLTARAWRSALVAALFGLHPLRVESVAWVAERKDMLSGLFWMLGILAYAGYARRRGRRRYLLTTLALCLGLMAKPMIVTLPFVFLLLDFWPLRRDAVAGWGALVREKAPWFGLSLVSSAVTAYAQRAGGAVTSLQEFPLGERLGNALISYARYLAKALWPAGLAVDYHRPDTGLLLPAALGCAAGLTLLTLAAWRFRGRGYPLAGWLWYLGTLVPVIGLVQVGSQAMADRYTYLPLIGVSLVAVWGGGDLSGGRRRLTRAAAVLTACVLAGFAAVSWSQLGHWRDSVRLFSRAVAVSPGSSLSHNWLGSAYADLGRDDRARSSFSEALRLDPGNYLAHFNLGALEARAGNAPEARRRYLETLRLNPRHANAHFNLGNLLLREDRLPEAAEHYRQAIRANPGFVEPYCNLGVALSAMGRADEAVGQYRAALALRPGHAEARRGLVQALRELGRANEARGLPRSPAE